MILKHRAGMLNSNANALSCIPVSEPTNHSEDVVHCCDESHGCNSNDVASHSGDGFSDHSECDTGDDVGGSDDGVCHGCGIYNGCG